MASRVTTCLFVNIVIVCMYSAVSGLFFHIGETEKKCFIEEIPDDTMVVGNYKVEVFDNRKSQYVPTNSGLGMFVEVKDPDEKIIMSRTYAAEGRFTFTSALAGEHVICLHSNSTAWFGGGRLRIYLAIEVGESAVDYAEVAKTEKLTELEVLVRKLLNKKTQIQREQDYQRFREERFRLTSESTNQRVLWWAIAQTVILMITGLWQMKHLKSFFEAKKLV